MIRPAAGLPQYKTKRITADVLAGSWNGRAVAGLAIPVLALAYATITHCQPVPFAW